MNSSLPENPEFWERDNIVRYATNKPLSDSQNKGSFYKIVINAVACFFTAQS